MRERLHRKGVLVVLCLAAAVAAGCKRPNPAYQASDGGPTGSGGGAAGGGGGGGGKGGAGGGADAGSDARMCTTAADCTVTAPCTAACQSNGTCAVTCPTCTDNDKDGYGTGAGCLGVDCDDNDPTVGNQQSCYKGRDGTKGKGVCRGGTVFCTTNAQSACSGQVVPGGEACNNQDDDCDMIVDNPLILGTTTCGLGACAKTVDVCATGGVLNACVPAAPAATVDGCEPGDGDCDGAVDEDCLTACVYVTAAGDDSTADGTIALPFRTIPAAITFAAAARAAGTTKNVCLAAVATCADTSGAQPFDSGDNVTLTMANGVSVYGNYESTGGTRCALTTLSTTIRTGAAVAVTFPATVVNPTTLDGVVITRLGSGGAASATGVLVDGAKQVLLSNIRIVDAPGAASTYGVDLAHAAEATIARSTIQAGAGTTEAIGIRSVGAKPVIRDNCSTFDATSGACTAACNGALGIRGRVSAQPVGTSAAILLDSSPGAIVDRNTICGSQAATGTGVHIIRDATGTAVRANTIAISGATMEAHGVWMDACTAAFPRIGGNVLIQADATAATATISAVGVAGDCHPVIDGNLKISGGGESAGTTTVGVFCGATGSGTTAVASLCTIIGNKLVQGAASSMAAKAVAISCVQGACSRIAGNTVVGGTGGDVIGISVASSSGTLVERNDVTGGCGSGLSFGALADDAPARFENNVLRGAACATGATTTTASGIRVAVTSSTNEAEVHSNTLDAGGAGTCKGAAATLGLRAPSAAGPPGGMRGVFRNNILHAGGCSTRYGLWEDDTGTSVRLLENNDFDTTGSNGAGAPTALYYFRNANPMNTINNGSGGVKGNISADPMFLTFPTDLHLGAASMCVNKGTTLGAPAVDFDGTARDAQPDIGAFEHK